jgi:uncharacterized phage-associated protein
MKALEVAKIVTTYFDLNGDLLTNKKLQKLLYYIEAWGLVYTGSIVEDDFEAWVHGPVSVEVYQAYKKFGYSPIVNEYEAKESASTQLNKLLGQSILLPEQKDLIFAVLNKYGSLSSFELESLSHSERPWQEARKGLSPFDTSSTIIDKQIMKEYYSSILNEQKG